MGLDSGLTMTNTARLYEIKELQRKVWWGEFANGFSDYRAENCSLQKVPYGVSELIWNDKRGRNSKTTLLL